MDLARGEGEEKFEQVERGNHNQNIFYKKKSIFNKKKVRLCNIRYHGNKNMKML